MLSNSLSSTGFYGSLSKTTLSSKILLSTYDSEWDLPKILAWKYLRSPVQNFFFSFYFDFSSLDTIMNRCMHHWYLAHQCWSNRGLTSVHAYASCMPLEPLARIYFSSAKFINNIEPIICNAFKFIIFIFFFQSFFQIYFDLLYINDFIIKKVWFCLHFLFFFLFSY